MCGTASCQCIATLGACDSIALSPRRMARATADLEFKNVACGRLHRCASAECELSFNAMKDQHPILRGGQRLLKLDKLGRIVRPWSAGFYRPLLEFSTRNGIEIVNVPIDGRIKIFD